MAKYKRYGNPTPAGVCWRHFISIRFTQSQVKIIWRITSRETRKAIFTASHILLHFLHVFLRAKHKKNNDNFHKPFAFVGCGASVDCDATQTHIVITFWHIVPSTYLGITKLVSCVFLLSSSWLSHTAHTIVSWPNHKQWHISHSSDLIMIIRSSIRILTIIIKEMGKLSTQSPIYCMTGNWEIWLHLRCTLETECTSQVF